MGTVLICIFLFVNIIILNLKEWAKGTSFYTKSRPWIFVLVKASYDKIRWAAFAIFFTNLSSRLACYTIYDLSELTVWPQENVQYWYIFAAGESWVLHLTDRFIYTELDFDTKPLALAIRCRGLGCSYFNVADDYCNRFTDKKIYLCIMTSIMCWKYIRAWDKT